MKNKKSEIIHKTRMTLLFPLFFFFFFFFFYDNLQFNPKTEGLSTFLIRIIKTNKFRCHMYLMNDASFGYLKLNRYLYHAGLVVVS